MAIKIEDMYPEDRELYQALSLELKNMRIDMKLAGYPLWEEVNGDKQAHLRLSDFTKVIETYAQVEARNKYDDIIKNAHIYMDDFLASRI